MKRFLALLLSALTVLALTSFAYAEGDNEVAAWAAQMKEKYAGQTVRCLVASHAATDAYSALTEEFTELTGIEVEMRIMSSNDMKALQRSNSATASGAFDLYMIDCTMVAELAQQGYVESLETYLADPVMTPAWFDYEDILPAYRSLGDYEGNVYAIPIAGESFFVGYRTDLFEKHGKTIPTTLDEMLELAQYFAASDEDVYGIVFRGQSGTHCGCVWNTLSFCFTDDPARNHVTGEYAFSEANKDTFEFYKALAMTGPEEISSYTHEDTTAIFSQGKSAMWLEATTLAMTVMDDESSIVSDKVDFFPIPKGPAGESGVVGGWTLGIPSDATAKEAAWAYIMYVSSKEIAPEYSQNGGAPNRASIFADPEILAQFPFYSKIQEAVEAAGSLADRGCSYMYNSPEFNNIRVLVGTELNRFIVDEIDLQTAFDNCARQIAELN